MTRYNDRSSRSHTVFIITAYVCHATDDGVDGTIQAGKLNLVDLTGSENLQRSGAKNKHAAEAALIKKSILTLARVINALVDLSPKSHLSRFQAHTSIARFSRWKDEYLYTCNNLAYQQQFRRNYIDVGLYFQGKNVRNQPQLNQPINKKMFLRDFVNELERLKTELICHCHCNVVLPV